MKPDLGVAGVDGPGAGHPVGAGGRVGGAGHGDVSSSRLVESSTHLIEPATARRLFPTPLDFSTMTGTTLEPAAAETDPGADAAPTRDAGRAGSTRASSSAWRAYIMGTQLLLDRLDRDLRAEYGISMTEYEILVRLSELPGRRMRMALLADALCHSRSRVTHTVARMEKAGLLSPLGRDGRRPRGRGRDDRRGLGAAGARRPRPTSRECAATWSTSPTRPTTRRSAG